jgi:hypothetical protein
VLLTEINEYKNSLGFRVEDRQTKNDKYFPNYSLGGGKQKHQKPAFTGRRRVARSMSPPPPHRPAKLRLCLLCFMMLWQPGRLLLKVFIIYRVPENYIEHKRHQLYEYKQKTKPVFCIFLDDSTASEFYIPTFRNTSIFIGVVSSYHHL